MSRHSPPFCAHPPKGFALLITITLLAFLVLLLVSLATLTRVETQVAGNSQHLAQARQNALLALNIAIGELQKYAGPDQRITAPADLISSTDGTGASTNAPSSITVIPGTRRWTGVWGNGQSAIGYDLRPDQISGRGATPVLLNWLVSGNETANFTLNPNGKGGVAAGVPPSFSPAAPGATTIELVGENTAGTSAEDKVSAPLVDIYAPVGITPGQSAASAPLVGHYAWWVGDEGVKARVNLQPGYLHTGGAPSDQINAFITSQRSALEFMDRDNSATPLSINTSTETNFDFKDSRVLETISSAQIGLLNTGNTVLASASKARFHDLTASSYGVLSDPYAGGLKKDLTADIADTTATGHNPAGDRPSDATPLFTSLKGNSEFIPTWGHVRSWARLHPDASGAITPVPPSATSAGIYPMLMYASLGLDVYVDEVAPPHTVHAAFFPVVFLNNPYPVTIAASRYRIGFKFNPTAYLRFLTAPAGTDAAAGTVVGVFDVGTPSLHSGTAPVGNSNFIYFVIDCPAIPPGETHAYRMDDADVPYSPGLLMTRFPAASASSPTGLTNHATLPTFITLPASITTADNLRLERMSLGTSIVYGADADLADPANQYQVYSFTVDDGTVAPPTGLPGFINTRYSGPGRQKISTNWYFPGGTTGARAALRMMSPIEGEQFYSRFEHAGMSSTPGGVAFFRHGNMRAPYFRRTSLEANSTGTGLVGMTLANDKIDSYRTNHSVECIPRLIGFATGIIGSEDEGTLRRMTIFDVLESSDRLLSLGQLQNAPLSRYGFQPAYPFGNSMADMRIARTASYAGTTSDVGNSVGRPNAPGITDPLYDLSWHLNRALWDRFFVSGVPSGWNQNKINQGQSLPNARMTYYSGSTAPVALSNIKYDQADATNAAYDRAAANLLVAGSFNINSTSEQAWRAVLGGPLGVSETNAGDYAYTTTDGSEDDRVEEVIPYPRFARSLSRVTPSNGYPALPVTLTSNSLLTSDTLRSTMYAGNRGLWLADHRSTTTNTSVSAVVNELARRIVAEIRARGPFLSLGDFINRPILGSKQTAGLKGALQSAIDTMSSAQANPYETWKAKMGPNPLGIASWAALPTGWDPEHFLGGPVSTYSNGTQYSPNCDLKMAFAPQYLTQADLLSTLGPQLSARSDTFTVRTYGEVLNPVTQAQEGRAWCEAVVQRVPDYVDSTQNPDPTAKPTGSNATWGRKFKIISFRWLSPQDI